MICKVCNTRIGPGRSTCPNCGSQSLTSAGDSDSPARLPHIKIDVPEEVELNEPAEIDPPASAPKDVREKQEEKEEPPAAPPPSHLRRGGPLALPDPVSLRAMLADNPQLLEPGLSVYTNDKGTPLGARYTSAVGEIDLLARDAKGDLVVVMVVEPHEGADLIAGMLQRIGWVRKHLGGRSQSVRGVVLMDQVRDDIGYAAAAVADTIAFKKYEVTLAFEDVSF